jgi:hypothetical protein
LGLAAVRDLRERRVPAGPKEVAEGVDGGSAAVPDMHEGEVSGTRHMHIRQGAGGAAGGLIQAEFVVAAAQVLANACPALITRAERSRFSPRIGLSLDLSRP